VIVQKGTNVQYPYLKVVDLETCSTKVDAAVLSVGGVTVYHNGDRWVVDNAVFYKELDVPDQVEKGAHFDPDTVAFHLKADETTATFRSIMTRKFDSFYNATAAQDIVDWFYMGECLTKLPAIHMHVVCRGTDFDPPILGHFLSLYQQKAPYKYWQSIDLRSLANTLELLGHKVIRPKNNKPHHALEDAIEEGHHLAAILNLVGGALDVHKFLAQGMDNGEEVE
jgi:hypothetical protein